VLRTLLDLLERDESARAAVSGAWAERDFFASYERPLLLLAAIHREALADRTFALAPSLFDGRPLDPAELAQVLTPPSPVLGTIRSRLVQTNEVTRSIAWRVSFPPSWRDEAVVLVDVGCSAGLNLVSDRLPLSWTTREGAPIELTPPRRVVGRLGLDRAPVDASIATEALWLRSCLWPGQVERRARLDAAIEAASIARARGELELITLDAGDMPAWLEGLSVRMPDARVLAYQSIFAEYLVPEARARFEAAMRSWVVSHPGRAVWLQFETAPRGAPGPVRITATVPKSGPADDLVIGASEYHPTSIALDRVRLEELWARLA
jgi:hypothetical protein